MGKLLILFLSVLLIPARSFSQTKIDCSSKVFQDSLLEVYSEKRGNLGIIIQTGKQVGIV